MPGHGREESSGRIVMRLFINGLAASAGGGLTYLHNVIPILSRREDCECVVAVSPLLRDEFRGLSGVCVLEEVAPTSAPLRFRWEQHTLPKLIHRNGADLLLSAGNFALRQSPVPQILLSRNSLYTSPDFYCDLRERHEYRLWLETKLRGEVARRSVHWADCTIAPSHAFAAELENWTGRSVLTIPHGFDRPGFVASGEDLSAEVKQKLDSTQDSFRLLFVSHYNYYRNFETLFRALALLDSCRPSREIKLILTCSLSGDHTPGDYRPEKAARLIRGLGVVGQVVELGAVPYRALHALHRSADAYVTAAYAESFAHPLVEAMSSGLPVIASDIALHREICGDAASYFPRFSSEKLADAIAQLIADPQLAARQRHIGLRRSEDFSWNKHVDELLKVANKLLSSRLQTGSGKPVIARAAAAG